MKSVQKVSETLTPARQCSTPAEHTTCTAEHALQVWRMTELCLQFGVASFLKLKQAPLQAHPLFFPNRTIFNLS